MNKLPEDSEAEIVTDTGTIYERGDRNRSRERKQRKIEIL